MNTKQSRNMVVMCMFHEGASTHDMRLCGAN